MTMRLTELRVMRVTYRHSLHLIRKFLFDFDSLLWSSHALFQVMFLGLSADSYHYYLEI